MTRDRVGRSLVLACAIVLVAAAHPAPGASARTTPAQDARDDIVVVMLDDVAADAMPALLARMPVMRDLFVDRGITFTNAYGQDPLCCPGRATFLTGLTSTHHGVADNDGRLFDPTATIATALQASGYHTTTVGKYLNRLPYLDDPAPPGWDRLLITEGGYFDYPAWRDGVHEWHDRDPDDYSTDLFADATMAFLREAPPELPRFLSLAPYAVHADPASAAWQPVPAPRHEGDARCHDIGFRKTPAYDEADVSDKPAWMATLDLRRKPGYDERGWPLQDACEALLSVDQWLKRVVGLQRRQGRLERTLFVLTADNGMAWGDHRYRGKRVPWATPLPLFVHWERALGDAPGRIDAWTLNTDLAPTLAAVAGATLGPFPTGQAVPDGVSLLPTLLSRGAVVPGRRLWYEEHHSPRWPRLRWYSLRTTGRHPRGVWRYTEWANGDVELYDLRSDPWELENVAAQRGDLVRLFHRQLATRLAA